MKDTKERITGEISEAAGTVPLCLIKQALSKEIRELKYAIVDPGGDVTPGSSLVCSFAATLQQVCSTCCKVKKRRRTIILLNSMHLKEIFTLRTVLCGKIPKHRKQIVRIYLHPVVCVRRGLLQT
ncbi:hypothetical protein [Methanolacinia petrolearia]|nr:hypothetical protein [Methanolacinia petrolearia]